MARTFFVGWQLWQQLTFVLAMGIVLVFLAGLSRLWWTNRSVRRQEVIDEEKRARVEEMRRSGIPTSRELGADIPFGIRALQGGVEVDGIWVSRPNTPLTPTINPDDTTKWASSCTFGPNASDISSKGKGRLEDTSVMASQSAEETTGRNCSSTNVPGRSSCMEGNGASSPSLQRACPAGHLHRGRAETRGDAERRANGKSAMRTYIPTSSGIATQNDDLDSKADRTSGSSLDYETADSGRMSLSNTTRKAQCMRPTSDSTTASRPSSNTGYCAVASTSPPRAYRSDPVRVVHSPFVGRFQPGPTHELEQEPLVTPPTFGSGDVHANRNRRAVNSGFEVLPAGTFGAPLEFRATTSLDRSDAEGNCTFHRSSRSLSRSRPAKLRKNRGGKAAVG